MLTTPPSLTPSAMRQAIAARCQEFRAEFGPEVVASIIDAFIPDVEQRLCALSVALDQSDAHAVAQEAHGLKGSCQNLGAHRLGEICRLIEEHGKSGHLNNLPQMLAELRAAWEMIHVYVEAEKHLR